MDAQQRLDASVERTLGADRPTIPFLAVDGISGGVIVSSNPNVSVVVSRAWIERSNDSAIDLVVAHEAAHVKMAA